MATEDKCCSLVPYFKVHAERLEAFRALCERFVEKFSPPQRILAAVEELVQLRKVAAR